MTAVAPDAAAARLAAFAGVSETTSRGERAFFVNPGGRLPRGTCFATIKTADEPSDRASRLGDGRWRLSFAPPKALFLARFGQLPKRPAKGEAVADSWDFAAEDALTPHPVHAWMGWMAVVGPSAATLDALGPLLEAAWARATGAADCRLATLEGRRRRPAPQPGMRQVVGQARR